MATIFNAELMYSTDVKAALRSGRHASATNNGALVVIGALESGDREVRAITTPAAVTDVNLGIVDEPEVLYSEETTKGLEDFSNEAAEVVRVRVPHVGDIFSVSDAGIDPLTTAAAIAVGSYVTIQAASMLLEEKATLGGTETFYGIVIDKVVMGTFFDGRAITMVGIEVLATA